LEKNGDSAPFPLPDFPSFFPDAHIIILIIILTREIVKLLNSFRLSGYEGKQVETIDGFMASIFRAFAIDLGVGHAERLEANMSPALCPVTNFIFLLSVTGS
jgi:hypothetical protein